MCVRACVHVDLSPLALWSILCGVTHGHFTFACLPPSPHPRWTWQKKPVRRRYEPYGMYSDDDANSDASSVCSERSYGSRNGGIPHYLRQTEDVAEVLNHCASSNWSERKEGLLGLQNLLKSQRTLRWGQEAKVVSQVLSPIWYSAAA